MFVVEDGKAAMRRIKVGGESGADVIVQDGLSGGEQVIVDGLQRVRAGSRGAGKPDQPAAQPELSRCSRRSSSTARGLRSSSRSSPPLPARWRMMTIPMAQYPDIVPPQVSVTTNYPGASAEVVDATVAQPIESQVVGVDKMIYMKSVSGDDGSYTLAGSFELGTDPDINTVNVNNRVQVALSKLPQDVQRQGVTVKKKSSALLGVIAVYSPKSSPRPAVHFQLRDDQPARPDQEHAGRRRRDAVGTAGLRHARLGEDRPLDRPRPDHGRHHQRDPGAERSGPGRAHRRPPDLGRPAAQLNIQTKGRLTTRRTSSRTSLCARTRTARCCGSAMSRVSSSAPPISIARRGSTAAPRP